MTNEERITRLEEEAAALRCHLNEMDKLIVRFSAALAVHIGVPQERIDQVLKEENDKVINKILDKLHRNN
jgi:hypothetical protein